MGAGEKEMTKINNDKYPNNILPLLKGTGSGTGGCFNFIIKYFEVKNLELMYSTFKWKLYHLGILLIVYSLIFRFCKKQKIIFNIINIENNHN